MYILSQISIAFLFIGFIIWKYNDEYVWWEYLLQLSLPILIAYGIMLLSTATRENDSEFWGNTITKVSFQEEYEEWDPCSYTVECCCSTDKDGVETCGTECVGACEDWGPYYHAYNERGESKSISSEKYWELRNLWRNSETLVDHAGDYCGKGDYHYTSWDGTKSKYRIYATKHTYKNKVRYNKIYAPPHIKTKYIDNVFNYPIIDDLEQLHILGSFHTNQLDIQKAELNLDFHSGKMGPQPREEHGQIKPFILLFKDLPKEVSDMQREHWQNGNKNEYTLMIGWDSNKKRITWYDIMTFTENGAAVNRMKEWLYSNPNASLTEITIKMTSILSMHWERREFTPLNAIIKLKPTKNTWIGGIISGILIGMVLLFFFKSNEAR